MRFRGSILACFLPLACSACTVVKVSGGDLRRYGGSLRLEPFDSSSIVTVTARNYGVVADGRTFLLGYGNSRTILVPAGSRCTAIIIVQDSSDKHLSRWKEFFDKYPNICVEGEKK